MEKEFLRKRFNKQNLPHSLIFLSNDDVALNEASLCFAKFVLCVDDILIDELIIQKIDHRNHADVLFYPQKSESINVEEMLNLIEEANTLPYEGDSKVFILNNFENTNVLAQNKLLKTLEEPPKNVYFVLNIKNEAKVLPTILSRCQKLYLPQYDKAEIEAFMKDYKLNPQQSNDIIAFCDGAINRAKEFLEKENFFDILEIVFAVWNELRYSSSALKYASKLYDLKEDFELFLYLYNIVLQDVIHTKLGLAILVKNQSRLSEYQNIAKDFSLKALQNIAIYITKISERIQKNCNQNIVIDNFLMKILEERAKWR